MKRKSNALEVLAFICIIIVVALVFIGMKYKTSWKKIPAPELVVPHVSMTETQAPQRVTESTSHVAVVSVETTKVSETAIKEPSREKENKIVTITLRSGRIITGSVELRTDTQVTLRTEAGITNIAWRAMKTNSFHVLHPELYTRLLERLRARRAKKDEEMRSKGYVQYKGEWLTKKELLRKKYRFSNQRVTTTVRSGQFKQADKGPDGSSTMNRKERGVLTISFRGLDPEQGYAMKADGCQYLKYRRWDSHRDEPEFASNTVNKTETMYGKDEYTFEYEFPEYNQHKGSARSNYRYGYESDDFMIKVWLDGDLIYEKPKGTFGEYFIIDSF